MTIPAAIQGNYADFKLVKTRSVAQIIVEVPIERAEQVVKMLGLPVPATEIAVGVAKLQPTAKTQALVNKLLNPEKPARKPAATERTRSQWAGIRCNDPVFQQWIWQTEGRPTGWEPSTPGSAIIVRARCGVQSRKELDTNPEKAAAWDALDGRFIEETRLPERHG